MITNIKPCGSLRGSREAALHFSLRTFSLKGIKVCLGIFILASTVFTLFRSRLQNIAGLRLRSMDWKSAREKKVNGQLPSS